MSRRGAIVIECDTPTCHAEFRFHPWHRASSVDDALEDSGWKIVGDSMDGPRRRDICAECAGEGKA